MALADKQDQILASASSDTTVRIWNVFGTDPPPDSNRAPPIGAGLEGEGSVLVALLEGSVLGGHIEPVSSIAFHPRLPLIATGGVRIEFSSHRPAAAAADPSTRASSTEL